MAALSSYYLPQFATTTLNTPGGLTNSQTTNIVLTAVPSDIDITKPGILCLTYTNPINTSNAEWITYTSIDGTNTLQGVTRAQEGFSAKTHENGATVAWVVSKSHINALMDAVTGVTTGVILNEPTLKSPSITTGDMNLATGLNIQVNGADPKRAMYIPASAMFPSTTNPCASLAQVESSTNDVNIKVLDFDGAGTTKESAEFGVQSPSYWDGSTITVQFIWYATAGSGTVNWEAQAICFSDDDALDTAYGTLQEVTDTLLATGDVHITSETSAITVAGSPVAGDWINIRVNRDPANDTNTSDARLMGVRVRFGVKQYNDA